MNDPDLSQCAREPIHIPGAIQPHGALLVASQDLARITHASANLHSFLATHAREALGQSLNCIIGEGAYRAIRGDAQPSDGALPRSCSIAGAGGIALELRGFRSSSHFCIDIERALDETGSSQFAGAQAVLQSFRRARSIHELCNLAVAGLRSITGYDRVMAYRFGPGGHGEVIAEARDQALVPYLGQWYPASDIPEQARQLYLRQHVGVIVDARYEPVPLLAEPGQGEVPVDLTHSSLRSVSPVHREFMRNMNTAASMTIGLESGDAAERRELWGMIVCHHQTPRAAGLALRNIADLIGHVLSQLIGSQISGEFHADQLSRQADLARIIARLAHPDAIIDALSRGASELLSLVRATGVVIRLHGALLRLGQTPDDARVEALFDLLRAASPPGILAVDDLGARDPRFAGCAARCSGALMLPLWKDAENAIIWLRPEQAHTVTWGGNPAKATTADAFTGRISPRASFAAWKEEVRGRSLPWSAADRALANELRAGIESEIARRTKLVLDLFGRIFASSPVALMLIDGAGRIKMVNDEADRIFGYAQGELPGRLLEEVMPDRFRKDHVGHRRDYVAHPSLRRMGAGRELYALHKDGHEFPIEITLNPVTPQEAAGEPLVQASITDLSARRASERAERAALDRLQEARVALEASNAELKSTNRELDQFVYTASHDLRSPLRGIGSLAKFVLEDDRTLQKETHDRLLLIVGRAERMQKMLDQILEYARAGKDGGTGAPVPVSGLIDELVMVLALPDGFVIVKDPSLAPVWVHPMPITQVLQNLIGNAVKHHDAANGTVTITVEDLGKGWRFWVSDDGPGVPEPYRESVFDMFATLHRRDEREASGMGLALVRKLVTMQGGSCGIEPASPRGARIWFDWPRCESGESPCRDPAQ